VTLILPLLIVLVGAALDWGLLFFVSHVTQDAVRQGARMAVTLNSPISRTTIRDEVRRLIPDAGLFSGFRTDANIRVECIAGTPPSVRVKIENVSFNFYFMRIMGLSSTPMDREAVMKYERSLSNCPTFS
jgi:hypothetical protein